MPNDRWDDFALDKRMESIDRRFDALEEAYRGMRDVPITVARTAQLAEDQVAAMSELREWIREVAATCKEISHGQEARAEMKILERGRGRVAIAVATIGAIAVVAGSVISAVVALTQ